jgi:hypothetical protein
MPLLAPVTSTTLRWLAMVEVLVMVSLADW